MVRKMPVDLEFFKDLLNSNNKKKVKREIEKLVSQNFDLEHKFNDLLQEHSELNTSFEDAKARLSDLAARNSSLEKRYKSKCEKERKLLSRIISLESSLADVKKALNKSERENKRLKNKLRIFKAMATAKEPVDLDTED